MSSPRPHFLVTNDDGIDSPLLIALVIALQAHGETSVAAPACEKSWIGKAISRHEPKMYARKRDDLFSCPSWEIDGTPADCVNLALGDLVDFGRIDMVVSGINMGSNAGLALILASGTVGGALEGALAGTHALATSVRLSKLDFERVKTPGGTLPAATLAVVQTIAQRSAALCAAIARTPRNTRPIVHNLNFPPDTTHETSLDRTVPASMRVGPLFAPTAERGTYTFAFNISDEHPNALLTDRAVLDAGRASYSILDFSRLGVPDDVSPRETAHIPPSTSRKQ